MLQKLSEQVCKCHERAAEAKRKAEGAADPGSKASYLDMEMHWLTLARSYAFAESRSEFSAAMSDKRQRYDDGRARAGAGADASRESEQRLRWLASIVESSNDPILSASIRHDITSWNPAAERLFGYTADEVIGQPIAILIPPDRLDEQRMIFKRITGAERIENYETVRLRKDGSPVDVSLTISAVKDAEGKIAGISAIYRDITERKRAAAREKVLMAELDHRVKNVLNRVDMILTSARNGSSTIDEFTRSVKGRIQSMAAAHYLLSQKGWHGVGLEALVRMQLAPYASHGNVAIHGRDVILTPAAIQAMGMVLHELVTNAAKHGAFSVSTGAVAVSWDRKPNGHTANLIFTWREFGGPPRAVEGKLGYGTRLIRELVPFELEGTVDLQFAPEGVNCKIEFPLSSEPPR